MTETATATVEVPSINANAKIADVIGQAVPVLAHANTVEPTLRPTLDGPALQQLARHLVNRWNGDALDVQHMIETLPVYGSKGQGTVRYTKQRAALLIALAEANACQATLAYTKYTYPNPNTGRRNYHVNVWGARVDVARTMAMFKVFEQRVIKDSYNSAVLPMAADARPADQTKIRREFFLAQVEALASKVGEVFDALATERKMEGALSDRSTAAETARAAHQLAEAQKGDAGETVESTDE